MQFSRTKDYYLRKFGDVGFILRNLALGGLASAVLFTTLNSFSLKILPSKVYAQETPAISYAKQQGIYSEGTLFVIKFLGKDNVVDKEEKRFIDLLARIPNLSEQYRLAYEYIYLDKKVDKNDIEVLEKIVEGYSQPKELKEKANQKDQSKLSGPLKPLDVFPNADAFTLSGVVFFDYNGNGVRDRREPPIRDARVQVENRVATTARNGSYSLQGVSKGIQVVRLSAKGFRYISLSRDSFQSSGQSIFLTIDGDTRRDWGLMYGFLTLPFRCGTRIKFIVYVDVDPGRTFRDWRGGRRTRDGHLGTDFYVSVNEPVVAAAPGVVIEAEDGWPNNPKARNPRTGLRDDGNRVIIDHGEGLPTIYCHLNSVSAVVGQKVKRGQTIALSGRTGRDPGKPHLHFQFGGGGQRRIDPYRNLRDPTSQSWWTKDKYPQCP